MTGLKGSIQRCRIQEPQPCSPCSISILIRQSRNIEDCRLVLSFIEVLNIGDLKLKESLASAFIVHCRQKHLREKRR
jgi:hypothetical protein